MGYTWTRSGALLLAAWLLAGCSSAGTDGVVSGSAGGRRDFDAACTPTTPDAGPAPSAACSSCLSQRCGATLAACYGTGWPSGDLSGGACGAYYGCLAHCACLGADGGPACFQTCEARMTPACQDCTTSSGQCMQGTCADACDGAPSDAGAD